MKKNYLKNLLPVLLCICVIQFTQLSAQTGWSLLPGASQYRVTASCIVNNHPAGQTQMYTVGGGWIRKSVDGGNTWVGQWFGNTITFTSVLFTDQNNGFATYNSSAFYKTTNAGSTWTLVPITGATGLRDITYSGTSLWIAGSGGKIYKSTNNGTSWTAQTSNTIQNLTSIHAISSTVVFAGGVNGTVCKTVNGGTTWTVLSQVGAGTINDITEALGQLITVSSTGHIRSSADEGVTWSAYAVSSKPLRSVVGSATSAYVCGDEGLLFKSTNGTSWPQMVTSNNPIIRNYVSLARRYITATATEQIIVAGEYGILSTTTAGVGCTPPNVTMISSDMTVCTGTDIILESASTGTVNTRTWKINGGNALAPNSSTNADEHQAVLNLKDYGLSNVPGTYPVTVEVTSACGTSTSASVNVIIQGTPAQPTAITKSFAIQTQYVNYTVSVTNVPGITYIWDADAGGTIVGSGNSVQVSWSTTGSKTLSVTPNNSCGGNGTPRTLSINVISPMTLSTLSPLDNANGVAASSNLTFSFSGVSGLSFISGRTITIKKSSDNSVFESFTIPSTRVTKSGATVTIDPTANFADGTGYYIEVEGGLVTNSSSPINGNAPITGTTAWNFTTLGGDVTPPTISTLTPMDGATGVAITSNLVATFSENVTVVASKVVSIKQSSDNAIVESYTLPSANVSVSGSTVTINPTGTLANSTGYYVNMDAGAFQDASSNAFAGITNTTTWNFTTVAAADVTPPTISTLSPLDGATGVAITSNLVATFSENVTAVASKVVSIKRASDNGVFESYTLPSGNVGVSGTTITINPTGSLANSTGYYVNIEAGAFEDAAGNDFAGIANTTSWNFTTVSAGDITPPTVVSLSPADNATGVPVGSNFVITFNENVSVANSTSFRIRRVSNNAADVIITTPSSQVTVSGNSITINPDNDLPLTNTEYWVEITSGISDLSNNFFSGISANTTWNFATAAPADVTPPVLASLAPVNTGTNLTVDSNLLAIFSENISAVNGKVIAIKRMSDNVVFESYTLPSANVGFGANSILINPSGSFANSTGYYVTMDPGTVQDLAGNPFAGISTNATWNFTTAAPAQQAQSITFGALAAKTFGDAPFELTATASSGLAVSYASSNTAVATVSGSTVTIVGVGSTTITASQGGNASYLAATQVPQALTINKANQTITFAALVVKTFGDAPFALTATASSGLTVTYASSNTAVATVSGSTVTIVGAGSTIITASQGGNASYNAATQVPQTLTVNKANQTISFSALPGKQMGDAPFALTAAATSGLALSYASSNTAVATAVGSTVTVVGVGTTTITASQTGNTNYNAATPVNQSLTVTASAPAMAIQSLSPLDNATNVDGTANLAITFNQNVDIGGGTISVHRADNDAVLTSLSNFAAGITMAGPTITFNMPQDLPVGVDVYVNISAGYLRSASDASNTFEGISNKTAWNFSIAKLSQAITFGALTTKFFGDANFSLSATASSGLTVSYASSNTTVATISGSTVTIVGTGTTTITASQAGNGSYNPASAVQQTLTVNKANQTITFSSLGVKTFGDANFNLAAAASSALGVSFSSSNTAVATVTGNTITIVGAGTTNITATQGGDARYNSATPVVHALTVNKADQTIAFGPLVANGISDPPFSLTATASSGLTVAYVSSNTSVATVSGNTVTLVGAGTANITASQSGNTNYNPASSVQQTLTVSKANQTITFAALAAKTFGDANFTLSASSSAGLPVSFISSNISVATVSGNTVTIVGAGTTNITASQAGNTNYNAASSVQQTLTVNKANQTITFTDIPVKIIGNPNFTLSATASSGLAISFSSATTSVATVSGNTVTLVGVGSSVITATQAGNANYNTATTTRTLVVSNPALQNQTITFNTLSTKTFGDAPFALSASASSGLTVSFSSSNTAVAIVSGSTVTIVGAGVTTLAANQSGNGSFNPATSVERVLTVNKASQTISFASLSTKTFGDANFTLSASASSGLSVSYASSNTAVATISGNTVTVVGAGSATITATQVGNATFNAATSIQQVLVVNKANQIITFNAIGTKQLSIGSFQLSATASSGLAVSYISSNTSIATVSGTTVTLLAVGTTTISALQSGNANYNAASAVSQQLVVSTKTDQSITFNSVSAKTIGDASFNVSATASSGLAVTYTTTSTKITLSGNQVTLVSAGRTSITASQVGNTTFNAAPNVNQSFCINPAKPIVTQGPGGEMVTLTSSSAAGNQWFKDGATISGATNVNFDVTTPGVYKVQVMVDDCVSQFSDDVAMVVTGDQASRQIEWKLFPNPAEDKLYITLPGNGTKHVHIIQADGRVLNKVTTDLNEVTVEVSQYAQGIYFVRIQNDKGILTGRFFKK